MLRSQEHHSSDLFNLEQMDDAVTNWNYSGVGGVLHTVRWNILTNYQYANYAGYYFFFPVLQVENVMKTMVTTSIFWFIVGKFAAFLPWKLFKSLSVQIWKCVGKSQSSGECTVCCWFKISEISRWSQSWWQWSLAIDRQTMKMVHCWTALWRQWTCFCESCLLDSCAIKTPWEGISA